MNAVRHIAIGLIVAASTFPASAPEAQISTPAARGFDQCAGFIDSLPATISTPGTWCLRRDLSTAIDRGNAIAVTSDNVTIDCSNFKIDGLEAGPDSFAKGIHSDNRQNITIRRCKIRGFQFGVNLSREFLGGRGGHLVEDNQLDVNIIGMEVVGDDSVVRRNVVRDTGRPGMIAQAMVMADSIDIVDNTISGVIGTGIAVLNNTAGSVSGNHVRDVTTSGISLSETGASLQVSGNHLNANPGRFSGGVSTIGIQCAVEGGSGPVFANLIVGFDRAVVGCNAFDNTIAPRKGLAAP